MLRLVSFDFYLCFKVTHKISPLLEDGAGKLNLAVTISGITGEVKK